MKNRPSMLLGLLLILVAAAYLDSPYSLLNKNYLYTSIEPVIAQPVSPKDDEPPDVIKKLEKVEQEDGYIVETYREYEVYRDSDSNVVKSVPTDKEDTLKYWDYTKK